MTHGEKASIKRAAWSDFQSLVNPNSKLVESMLAVMIPLALAALVYAIAAIAFGGLSLISLLVIISFFLLLPLSTTRR